MNISAVIIAKNEADRISATIASVIDVVAEVIVLDTGSSDDTITVAELAGARVISQKWQGYGPTKNMGAQYAHYDWILSLDADEVLSQELSVSLENIKPQRGNTYSVNRLVNYKSQWITGCGFIFSKLTDSS